MKLKNLLAFLLSFVTLFTTTMPVAVVFAEDTESGAMYYVGEERECKTINEALDKVKQNPPKSEAERAVINIDPGTYEEQIIFDNLKYITIRQTPDTSGLVKLSWYYCTGYAYSNCDLEGKYNPDIDWYDDRTWNGYKDDDEKFTKYLVGQPLSGISEISYYDKNGVAHKNEKVKKAHLGSGFSLDGMAPLCVKSNCTDITIEDLHIVNSVPVMVTQGEKDAHITPEGTVGANGLKPRRENLSVCDEDVEEVKVNGSGSNGILTNNDVEKQRNEPFSPGESAYIARSGIGNERGHAISLNGDRIIVKNVYARGNQDSVYISTGRIYFEDCNLIGGTDYIYGSATAVFNNCKLGLAGMSDKSYGSPMATPATPTSTKYGYLFYNCMIYNIRTNNGANDFGGSWGSDGQSTFYNTTIDNGSELYGKSKEVITDVGWTRFGVENGTQRMYEYGTKNADGTPVDTSKRIKNKSVEEGGPGMGTVIDEWQVLEFNPRNYFSSNNGKGRNDDWDPMNFGKTYLEDVDSEIEKVNISVPAGNETTVILPEPANSNVEFKWESMSDNAVVSDDGKSIEVIRPALGEEPIQTSVILYARDKQTKFGDKRVVDITIASTTDLKNVFNIPVVINASTNADGNCDYTITITKNGALIKQTKVTVMDGEMNTAAVIENLPANAEGIEYDIKIVSSSDEFAVTAPEEGKTKIIGKTGVDVPLNITAQKIVDKTVDIDEVFTAGTTDVKNFDLISLAKGKGADGIDSSDIITIDYDVKTTGALTKTSYIDLTSKAASSSCNISADKSRFVLWRFYGNWNQLDMVDSSAGFSGTKNIEGTQWLNIVGKFTDASKTSHVTTTINYKTASIMASGSGSNNLSSFVFEHFPENYVKGKLNLTVYPGGSDLFTIFNIKVTYKDVVTGDNSGGSYETVEDSVNTDAVFTEGTANVTSFDLIDLSKKAGADESITSSNIITVDYDIDVSGAYPNTTSCVDLTAGTAYGSIDKTAADNSRFVLGLFNEFWNQYDMVDCSRGITYADLPGTEWLNACGKFDYSTKSHITVTIDYKNKIITAKGSGSGTNQGRTEEVFEHFPTNYKKGVLNLIVYPGEGATFSISNIKVTYQKIVKDDNNDNNGDNDDNDNTEKNPSIINAEISDGNTIVNLKNISDGVVVAVKYDEGKMKSMKTAPVSGDSVTISEIEANSVFVWDSIEGMKPLCKAYVINSGAEGKEFDIDFTKMEEVPVYSTEKGQGFVSVSSSIMPDGYARKVADISEITISKEGKGASVTESDGSYLKLATDDNNFGGLIYRVDTGAPGAYHIEVEVDDANKAMVAPTGMTANSLTSTGTWDTAGLVNRLTSAKWEGSKWSYDFATGEKFIEIEIEPKELPAASKPQTVAVKSIKVTPIAVNPKGSKPTIHILGDSTQKTYTFHSTISSWGQTLIDYFDTDKVNVVNYSLGGRSMKTNYMEGRTDDVLMRGKKGDFVFIHSAHNDETNNAQKRTIRGTNLTTSAKPSDEENEQYREASNALYNRWLDMYVEAIKARGMTPVLVTAMPRINGSTGKYSEGDVKPNGFYPDSPGNMRKKAATDKDVALIELYDGAKDYIDSIDGEELRGIYNQLEAGEMPGGEGSSTANGNTGDGTHYKESAGRQWCRIMLESMYVQSNASEDVYTDKKFMTELVSYTKKDVQDSMKSGDWSKVFPEMALDVSAVGIVPGATKQNKDNYYFRNSIEKVLQLGIMSKDSSNKFYPTNLMTVGEFARSAEKAFGLEANSLTSYNKTYAELKEAGATEITLASMDLDSKSLNVSSSKTSNVDLAADGEYTVKVNQVDGGTITVYNETDFAHKTVDITDGITANKIIDDNDYFTLIAPSEVVKRTDSKGVFKNKDISTVAIELRNNGTKQVTYKAKESGILTMYLMFVGNKFITCENLTDNTMQQKYNNDTTEKNPNTSNDYVEVTFDVEKGKEYSLYTNGGTGRLFGVQYTTEQQTSQEEITVKSGTVVKVVAERQNAKWRLESILKDGKAVEDGSDSFVKREYTFTVDGNTIVSAKFNPYSEPDVVKTTLIASDAVLTREAMAAVLYDAYSLKYGDKKLSYMTDHNGTVMSPDDPAYDPNIKQEGSYYWPITGWDVLKDIDGINKALYGKAKEVYNLGLMRSDLEYKRGSVANGEVFEPTMAVTRARAAKALAFIYILTQPELGESQVLPNGNLAENVTTIQTPNTEVPSTPYEIK